jgi:hypothetical protein
MVSALTDPGNALIGDVTCERPEKFTDCQLRVFLAYAGRKGRTLIDRELNLPREPDTHSVIAITRLPATRATAVTHPRP